MHTVAGIDVGGDKKGCNLVVLRGTTVLCSVTGMAPEDAIGHSLRHDVMAVGVDAPAAWRVGAAARQAERDMARAGISAFSTPTRQAAAANPAGFFGWMLNGERVYQALADAYPLLAAPRYSGGRVSFETFPHAITAALLGKKIASAKLKHMQRRQILEDAGIATATLASIDALDAALCALAATYLLGGKSYAYGDAADGFIHVPAALPPLAPD